MDAIEPVTIQLDRDRHLVLTMGALARAERMLNRQRREDGEQPTSIFRMIDDQISGVRDMGLSAQFLHVMLWAILTEEDPSLTMADTSRLVRNPLHATAKLCEAVGQYFTPSQNNNAEVGDDDRPLARPNGSGSPPPPGFSSM